MAPAVCAAFVQRLRLERAANALRYHGDRSILAVALDHGFSSAATFARAFKAHFGMSATDWRRGNGKGGHHERQDRRAASHGIPHSGSGSTNGRGRVGSTRRITIDRVSRSTAATRKSPGGQARFAASSASR
ncbi:MAG: hypothetical protein DMD97_20085 [Candidatus Rokuibacteriota bacterium]|nr:MAG: hypothetical protein DMD97_20085 [Candidatus Rokubacteria bacterium]